MNQIKKGDLITFKPEWRDAGDCVNSHIALEDQDGNRVLVQAVGTGLPFPPTQRVIVDMIERD